MCTAALLAGIAVTSSGGIANLRQTAGVPNNRIGGSVFDDGDFHNRAEPIHEIGLSVDDYLEGEWRLAEIAKDGSQSIVVRGLHQVPGRIVFTNAVASYSACTQYDFAFLVDAEGRLRKLRREPFPNSSSGCPEMPGISYPLDTAPVEWDAMRVLHGDPALSILGLNILLLTDGPFVLVLQRLTPPPEQPL